MLKLVEMMHERGVEEEDNKPWGALVVLDAKPHQENVPWHKYQWRMCVSYQNSTSSPAHLPSQYLAVKIHYRKLIHKQIILLL